MWFRQEVSSYYMTCSLRFTSKCNPSYTREIFLLLSFSIQPETCWNISRCFSLQSGIGLQDLGQFYHQPIKDANGSIILTTVKCHNSTKSVNISQHVKWTPLNKIQRRSNGQADNERTAVDILMDTANVNETTAPFAGTLCGLVAGLGPIFNRKCRLDARGRVEFLLTAGYF